MFSAPPYAGPKSDHFDGERFHNLNPARHAQSVESFIRFLFFRRSGHWRDWTELTPQPPPPPRVTGTRLRATFINHATVLVQTEGLNLLTDPVWSERVSPVSWAGPRRHRPPGLRLEDLPPIDAVIVSHNHYDHLDLETLKFLARRHAAPIIVPLGNRALLEANDIGGSTELDWWEAASLARGARVTAVPAQHFSGRGTQDRDRTLWCGFVIETRAGTVYFAGDTGFGSHFHLIAGRFPKIRLALLPIGAYQPRWFMSAVHISPEEAVHAHEILNAHTSMGIHFGTFALSDDAEDEPVVDLERALRRAKIPRSKFFTLEHGEGRDVPPLD
jgi:L-ascorbate metabolism protein UlaG (beta-lactamase superfamily)